MSIGSRHIYRVAGCILGLLVLSTEGSGQERTTWTLKQCIDYALENNIQIKQTRLNVDMAAANVVQSKANLLPRVNAFASHSYNFGRSVDPFSNDFVTQRIQSNSFSISGNVTLYSGLTNYNTVKQQQEDWQAAKYDSDKATNDIMLAVAGNYLEILFNMELEEVARNQVSLTGGQLDRMRKLVKAGSIPRGDLLEIEAQLALDELQQIESNNRWELSILTLQQLLDLDPAKEFDIAVPELTIEDDAKMESTPGLIYDAAIAIMPEVKAAGHRLNSSATGLAIAKGSLSPTLSLGGSYGTGYSDGRSRILSTSLTGVDTLAFTTTGEGVLFPSYTNVLETTPFFDQIKDNVNQNIGFNLSIPIFNGLQSRTSIKLALISMKNAEYTMELEKQRIKETIERAYLDATAALKKFRSSRRSVAALQESFDYAKKKFDVGLLTTVEFNDSKNKLAKASSDMVQAKYDYIFKTKVLDFYQGNSLAF
ncbi:MAG: TolC family protein [Flavobacteriales bacterium]|nr:TolC family protein [Flavobacteriales bacterium]